MENRMSSTVKMLMMLLTLMMLVLNGKGATLAAVQPDAQPPTERCDPSEIEECDQRIPYISDDLLKTKNELDAHCRVYGLSVSCMDAWVRRCLPAEGQRRLQQEAAKEGVRDVMHILCKNKTLRQEYLKEQNCWARVAPAWSFCVHELQSAQHDIRVVAQLYTKFNRNRELCSAKDDFMSCVTNVVRPCSASAGGLLRRLARELAQDPAVCSSHAPRALSALGLTALFTLILYLTRI